MTKLTKSQAYYASWALDCMRDTASEGDEEWLEEYGYSAATVPVVTGRTVTPGGGSPEEVEAMLSDLEYRLTVQLYDAGVCEVGGGALDSIMRCALRAYEAVLTAHGI